MRPVPAIRAILALALSLTLLSGCALFGNVGPLEIACTDEQGRTLELKLPQGSGRVFPSGIDASQSPCGLKIDSIQQGEDRSSGLLGLLGALIFGG